MYVYAHSVPGVEVVILFCWNALVMLLPRGNQLQLPAAGLCNPDNVWGIVQLIEHALLGGTLGQ